jgi:hypothetical protein
MKFTIKNEYSRGMQTMTVKEIKVIAKRMGLQAGKMKKANLIRTIQAAEGNNSCFQTGVMESCGQENCCWRSDCM